LSNAVVISGFVTLQESLTLLNLYRRPCQFICLMQGI